MKTIVVADYDPAWAKTFERLRSNIWAAVKDVASSVEHVGSTSVPGLAAKPVIDIDIVVPARSDVPLAVPRLASLGYVHRGNLGIEDREAFDNPEGLPAHHLYLCPRESTALANHLVIRDYLRAHPEAVQEYGDLKKQLASQFPHDIDSYINGKTPLLLKILRAGGFPAPELERIEQANRKPQATPKA